MNSKLVVALLFLMTIPVCSAQENQAPAQTSAQPQSVSSSAAPSAKSKPMFGIMPSYGLVEEGQNPPPLRTGQKFALSLEYLHPYTFVFVAAQAGINQALDSPKEYGQGAEGYGNRFGAAFADGLTSTIFSTGIYPSLFHQDPRYYRRGQGSSSGDRFGYALTRVLVTRQDSGRKAFNISEILGSFTSGAISTTYYPYSQRDFAHVAEHAGIRIGFAAGLNLLKEFYPDLKRKLSHKN